MGIAVQYRSDTSVHGITPGIKAIATKCGKLYQDESTHRWISKFSDHEITTGGASKGWENFFYTD